VNDVVVISMADGCECGGLARRQSRAEGGREVGVSVERGRRGEEQSRGGEAGRLVREEE
jgi:hypothetical protein